jgi:hypothetical protein
VTEYALPTGDTHEVIHLGGHAAVIVPLDEYHQLRLAHDWRYSPGRVRTNAEEFLAISGLSAADQRSLAILGR